MSPSFYHVVHVFSIVALIGYGFYAYALPTPETKKRVMMITGLAALLALISGFGLLHVMGYEMKGWVIVKMLCWLGLAALPGIAYRRRERAGTFIVIALLLALIALTMVYYKPF
jgi:hypothetical protein